MKERHKAVFLGIEAGATRTVAIMADADGQRLRRATAGPANLKLLDDRALPAHFKALAKLFPKPTSLAIGMAGARTERDFARIRQAATRAWPNVPCYVTNDLETALAAAPSARSRRREEADFGIQKGPPRHVGGYETRVLILSGTGSCCFGVSEDGAKVKVGGWGHILGDKGSGYEIGLRGLKASVYYYDRDGVWSRLGQRLLRKLALNEPNELIPWVLNASKADIAALAVEVFAAWHDKDPIASDIIEGAANRLAKDGAACAKRLAKKGARVQFVLAGSVLLQQPKFAKHVTRLLRKLRPNSIITPLEMESAWGAVVLARRSRRREEGDFGVRTLPPTHVGGYEERNEDLRFLTASPTETRNARTNQIPWRR